MVKRILGFILVAVLLLSNFAAAEGIVFQRARFLSDPYRYMWEVEEGGIGGLVRFFTDVNFDNKPDLVIGSKSLLTEEGGTFHIFINLHDGYMDTGPIFLNPRALVIAKQKNKGLAIVKTVRGSSAKGNARMQEWHYTGLVYELAKSEKYSSSKHGNIQNAKPFRLESSGKTLLWTPPIEKPN